MARSSVLSTGLLGVAAVAIISSTAFTGTTLAPPTQPRFQPLAATASAETMVKIADVVADQLGVDKEKVVGPATLSELGADSQDVVETVMALEETFDVELPEEETTE